MPEAPKTRNLPDDPAHGLRTPPQSIQSEQAVLGGLLIDNTALDSVADLITAEDFCRRDHQIIYEHIVSLIQHGKPADIVTVGESIKNSGVQTALAETPEASGDAFYNFVSENILPYAKAEPAYLWEISRKYADALETVTQLGKDVVSTLATLEMNPIPYDIIHVCSSNVI